MKFFFSINKAFVQHNVFEDSKSARKEYYFEGHQLDAILVIPVIKEIFSDKISEKAIEEVIIEFKQFVVKILKEEKMNEKNKSQSGSQPQVQSLSDKSSNSLDVDITIFNSLDYSIFISTDLVNEWFITNYRRMK